MFDSPIGILLFGAVILIAAFLGSWLASFLNLGRKKVSVPEPIESGSPYQASVQTQSEPRSAEPPPVRHAFDFSEDQMTIILEMPVELLGDDATLADVWVDVVGWARMAWQDVQEGKTPALDQVAEGEAESLDEKDISREHLEDSLQRLHDAAERRRELRLKLAERQNSVTEAMPV